ncbi:MAG: hypothetical protein NTZ09_02650 [Candidatus Hydrogenedentes bacterium]|nr:hypothetical protein [Candidatus Hydrogenedentota bacterium]
MKFQTAVVAAALCLSLIALLSSCPQSSAETPTSGGIEGHWVFTDAESNVQYPYIFWRDGTFATMSGSKWVTGTYDVDEGGLVRARYIGANGYAIVEPTITVQGNQGICTGQTSSNGSDWETVHYECERVE